MSKWSVEKITCPNCQKESDFRMWSSINTMLDPEMKEKVRTNEAFKFICPFCNEETNVEYTCLYHQMEDHVMIYYVTGDNIDEAISSMSYNFENQNVKDDFSDFFEDMAKEYQNRVVTTKFDFREKLMILDAGLNDKFIEIMKIMVLQMLSEQGDQNQIQEIYFYLNEAAEGEKEFFVRLSDGKVGYINFDQQLYDAIAHEYEEDVKSDKSVVVDFEWALNILRARH